MKYIPRIAHYLRPYWRLAVTSVLVTLLLVGSSLLAPWPLKILVDHVLDRHPLPDVLAMPLGWIAQERISLLIFAVAAGLVLVVMDNVLNVFHSFVNTKLEQRMALDFRSDLFAHAEQLSMAFHDQRRSGNLIYAITFQADAVPGILMALLPMAQSALTLVGMFWIAFSMDAMLALLAVSVVPFLYYSVGYYAKRVQPRIMEVKQMEGETISIIHEAMSMLRVIVTFVRERFEHGRMRGQGELAVDARVKLTVWQTVFSLAVNTITGVGTALVLGFGAYHVIQGRLTVGELLVIMAYIAAVYTPLEAISTQIGQLQEHFVSLQYAFDMYDTKPDIEDAPDAFDVERVRGDIVYDHVHFSYSGRVDTLKDISFEVKAGQVVAIVGPTGAGKTTLISLLPRLYDAKEGRILLDGTDIRQLTLKSLREQISVVLQEPLLFSGTIADNIRYGRLEATMDEIVEAARDANAHDFISALPEKYDTVLGERGAMLSGGERQRISVARAFLKNAPILILDEPTSAIDSKTEAVILDALDRLMVGRTTFMIAHRLSTIRQSDLILVVDKGEIAEQGTHDELLENDGLYKQLYDMQVARVRQRAEGKLLPHLEEQLEPVAAEVSFDTLNGGHGAEEADVMESEISADAVAVEAEPAREESSVGVETAAEDAAREAEPVAVGVQRTIAEPTHEIEGYTLVSSAERRQNGHGGHDLPGGNDYGPAEYRIAEVLHVEVDMTDTNVEDGGGNAAGKAVEAETRSMGDADLAAPVSGDAEGGPPANRSEMVIAPVSSAVPVAEALSAAMPVEQVTIPVAGLHDLRTLENLVIGNPEDVGAQLALGSAYLQMSRHDDALALYRHLLKKEGLPPFVLKVIEDRLSAFIHKYSGNPDFHLVRGDLYILQGRYLEAVREYNIMTKMLPSAPR